MAGTLMLVNPRKRRHAKRKASATHKRHHVTKHKRRSVKRHHNPIAHVARRRVKRHRNPIAKGAIMGDLKAAFAGAVGAIGVDVAMGYVKGKLPVSMQTGTMGTVAKLGLAVALGWGLHKTKLGGKAFAANAVKGAMTVSIHEALKNTLASAAPSLPLAAADPYDDDLNEFVPVNGRIAQQAMGEFVSVNGVGDIYSDAGIGDIYSDAGMNGVYPSPYEM